MGGRFLSPDPAGFGGSTWDLYSYANNDPINQLDADGRFGKQVYNSAIKPSVYGWADNLGGGSYYSTFLNPNSQVSSFFYEAGWFGMEATKQVALGIVTEGFGNLGMIGRLAGGASALRMGGTMTLRAETAALRTEAMYAARLESQTATYSFAGSGNTTTLSSGGPRWEMPAPAAPAAPRQVPQIQQQQQAQAGVAAANSGTLRIGPYGELSGNIAGQAHHLNQTAAFRDVIPRNEGLSIELQGNIFTDAGAPHTLAHQSMEGFWSTFRGTEIVPSNLQYTRALQQSLRAQRPKFNKLFARPFVNG